MNITIRSYDPQDYEQIADLYKQSDLYGGQFDDIRDSAERLQKRIEADADAILIAEIDGNILGTISLIEDGRVAGLFRFAVAKGEYESAVAAKLYERAKSILKVRGHAQVLVYSPAGNERLDGRYERLGFHQGGDYTCFWQDI